MDVIVRLGSKIVGIAALIISCVAVAVGVFWLQQESSLQYQGQQKTHQNQTAELLHQLASLRVEGIKQQMTFVAESPDIISQLENNSTSDIDKQQRELKSLFPNARNVCLISASVDDIDPNACVPISFATLNSLRKAKKDGFAPIALMKQGTENANVLLAHRIGRDAVNAVGVLVVTLNPDTVKGILHQSTNFQGYVELQQGSKKVSILDSYGDVTKKQGAASYVQAISDSYWRIAYWPSAKVTVASTPLILAIILAIIVLAWLCAAGIRQLLLKKDVAMLSTQLTDFKSGLLKPKYPLSFKVLESIVNEVQELDRANYHATAKKGATADSISKKVEQQERSNTPEFDQLREITEVDPTIFKANDIRGIVGVNLNEDIVKAIGQAIGSEAGEQGQSRLVVGRDGRLSSASLSNALIEGILASGCDVLDIGEVPTPVMYYACEKMGTNSGVMVTGSHNPAEYNGLKVILAGQTLSTDKLALLHQRIQQDNIRAGEGSLSEATMIEDYIARVASEVVPSRPIKVVIDCGNGVTGTVAPALFQALGCEVIELFCEVDGTFPNHHPNPSDPNNLEALSAAVKQHGAELGIAFDGDGDRLGVVDGYGEPVWPDRLLMLFAQDILSRLPGSAIVYDVKCSNLLGEEISKAGGEAVMTKSGYAFIKEKMQAIDAPLGGELSGHIFFKERWYGFDDGLYAASRLLELLSSDIMQRRATEIFGSLPTRQGTAEIYVEMDEGESLQLIRQLAGEGRFDGAEIITIDGVRAEYPNGWGLVRASNTMPGLSLRFEADSVEELHDIQQRFKQQMLQIKPTLILLF